MIELVPYTKELLDLSWGWLNDPEIKHLTDTPDFTKADQEKWFESLSSKSNYRIWGVIYDQQPVGVTGLKNITADDCEYWGYIGEKKYWGRGIGTQMLAEMEKEVKIRRLKSICLKVLIQNERACRLYLNKGYRVETTDGNIQLMRKWLI